MSALLSEIELFQQFLADHGGNGAPDSLEAAIQSFRVYQAEIQRLSEQIRPALERGQANESNLFDLHKLQSLASEALANRGMSE